MSTEGARRGFTRAIPRKNPDRGERRSPFCVFHGVSSEFEDDPTNMMVMKKTVTKTGVIIVIRKNQILAFTDHRIIIPMHDIRVAETAEEIFDILQLEPV